MTVARQLFELQGVDLDIEAKQAAVDRMTAQLGETQALRDAREKLSLERRNLEELSRQQRSLETDIDDLSARISGHEKDLYSGRIHIPKELSSLQQEIDSLKARRSQMEDDELALMDRSESSRKQAGQLETDLKTAEVEWGEQQRQLTGDLAGAKEALTTLKRKRGQIESEIEGHALDLYGLLRKQKGTAVARVEQGICRGCRISLPVNELQLARGGGLVQCGSCGRILYLA